MPATIREKLIAVLTAQGYQKVNGGSHKYVTLAHPGVANSFLFVGKSGALRQGECASRSRSVDALKKSLLSGYGKTKFVLCDLIEKEEREYVFYPDGKIVFRARTLGFPFSPWSEVEGVTAADQDRLRNLGYKEVRYY